MLYFKLGKMNKLKLFWIMVVSVSLSWMCFWYFEDKVYCDFDKNNLVLDVKWWESQIKCKTYLDVIQKKSKEKYSEITLIRDYISQGEDLYYWKPLLEEREDEFLRLINYRDQIKWAINRFESDFYEKYYVILEKPMRMYYSDLEMQYYSLINDKESHGSAEYWKKIVDLEQQMWNVSHILWAKTLDEIIKLLPTYIYQKSVLEWK